MRFRQHFLFLVQCGSKEAAKGCAVYSSFMRFVLKALHRPRHLHAVFIY